jgi:type III secretory pathway component EscV
MPFIAIVIGAIVVIAAVNNAHGDLGTALKNDIPAYFKWAIAIAAVLGLGYIPGMRTPSRYLMALVAIVLFANNWQSILAGFQQFAQGSPAPTGTGAADPTAAYVQSGGQGGTPSQQQIAGNTGAGASSAPAGGSGGSAFAGLNPNSYIGLAAGFGGLA